MALHLYFSNDVETLADEFVEKLNAAWPDPLWPPVLLVPNRYVEKWLKLFVSRKQGVLVGLRGEFIEKFLWRVLVQAAGDNVQATLIDGPLLCQAILHVMARMESEPDPGGLAALRTYLSAEGPEAGRVKRRIGLATRLSGLFLEYEYSRPDLYDAENVRRFDGLLRAWPDNDYFAAKNAEALSMETWQRQLYKRAMEAIRGRLGPEYVTLPGALSGQEISLAAIAGRAARAARATRVTAEGQCGPVFVFGMSGMSLFHRQVMLGLSRALDVHVFTLNPCSAFWEDVDTTGREMGGRVGRTISSGGAAGLTAGLTFDQPQWTRFARDDWDEKTIVDIQEFPGGGDENRLLALWGHAGKENIALWCQAAEYRFNELYAESPGSSVLSGIQRSILYRSNEAKKRCAPDDSLIVFDAPGIRREVETMRDFILEAMRGDETLLPSDIGVFIANADAGEYGAALHEVLDEYPAGHPFHVPWLMADERGKTSLFCKAVTDILRLPDSGFGRSAVFSLLRNPLVAAACGADQATIDIWETWAAQCRVCHGLDRKHRQSLGEHDPSPQHTWRMAFERLLCGEISDTDLAFGPASGGASGDAPDDPEETVRPFGDFQSRDTALCGRFVRTIEALFCDIGSLSEQKTWKQASDKLIAIIRAWTKFGEDFSDEERVADQYVEDISLFAVRDRLQAAGLAPQGPAAEGPAVLPQSTDQAGGTFDFEEFKMLAMERADVDVPVHSAYLTGRLTVSCLRPSRAIPFLIVYVLGMNEGSFPGSMDKDTLDLRTWKHVPGDLRPVRQAQYAFLELLMCARQRLVLSFIGRDITRDEPLLACSTVFELQSFVNNAILEPGKKLEFSRVPLLAEGEEKAAQRAQLRQPPTFSAEAAIMVSGQHAAADTRPGWARPTVAGAPEVVHYSTPQLALFLRNPIEYTLRRSLNLDDDDDAAAADDAEPFAASAMDRWRIKRCFAGLVCDYLFGTQRGQIPVVKPDQDLARQWELFLGRAYRDAMIRGAAAERVLGEFDMLRLADETRALAAALVRIAREKRDTGWVYEPSAILQMQKDGIVRPYAELSLEKHRTLRIASPPHRVFFDPENENRCEVLEVCVSGATVRDNEVVKRKNLLEPALFCCAMSASGAAGRCSVLFVGLTDKSAGAVSVLHAVAEGDGAGASRTYLTGLAIAIEDPGQRFDHVPFEIIEDLRRASGGGCLRRQDVEDRLVENDENSFRQVYRCDLEACAIAEKSVPDDNALEALIRERFGIIFGAQAGGNSPPSGAQP